MRSCLGGAECEPKEKERQMMFNNTSYKREYMIYSTKKCGLDFAYAYFCSFVFFSTFLVKKLNYFILFLYIQILINYNKYNRCLIYSLPSLWIILIT